MPFVEITVEPGQASSKHVWILKHFLLPIYLIENVVHNEAQFAQSRKIRHAVGGRVGSVCDAGGLHWSPLLKLTMMIMESGGY